MMATHRTQTRRGRNFGNISIIDAAPELLYDSAKDGCPRHPSCFTCAQEDCTYDEVVAAKRRHEEAKGL